jgi:hypothetical protein
MTLALDGYKSIESNLFVRISLDYYKANAGSSPSSQVLRFSDRLYPTTINSESYTGLGKLMSISASASELRASSGELSITIAGIPNTSIYEIVNSRFKGASITVYRAIFDSSTNSLISIAGNPMIRFKGYINNLSLDEDYDVDNRQSSNTLVLTCSSVIDLYANKIAGRRTNPSSQKKYFSSDVSMDKVPNLENSFFDFGANK